jgi:hypothetical protein
MEIVEQFSITEEPIEDDINSLPPSPSPLRSPSGVNSPNPFLGEEAKTMSLSRLREALMFADPDNQRAAINKLLARACGVGTEEMIMLESKKVKFSVEFFKNNLKQGLLKKSYPTGGGGGGGGAGGEGRKLGL